MATAGVALALVCAVMAAVLQQAAAGALVAEQVHIALTGVPSQMAVDFVSQIPHCAVHANNTKTTPPIVATSTSTFIPTIGYQHQALLEGLKPNQFYDYKIICGESARFGLSFKTLPLAGTPEATKLRTVFFADYGLDNDVSNGALTEEAVQNQTDVFIHGGDIAYDLMANHSETGNEFMNAIEPFSSARPYMIAVGNHEKKDNFTQFHQRFNATRFVAKNSGSNNRFFYSFDVGLIHFVAIMTEIYMFPNETANSPSPFLPEEQLHWLEQDLAKAQARRKNASDIKWIVAFGHKGWSMDYEPNKKDPLQHKLTGNFSAFSPLFEKYNVDLYLTGHVHLYQRFYPLLGPAELKVNGKPQAVDHDAVSKDGHTYTNPKYLTTIVAGSPGDQELTRRLMCAGETVIQPETVRTMAECRAAYGYGKLEAPNATHLYWSWKQTGEPSESVHQPALAIPLSKDAYQDYLWIVRTNATVSVA